MKNSPKLNAAYSKCVSQALQWEFAGLPVEQGLHQPQCSLNDCVFTLLLYMLCFTYTR